MYEIGKTLVSEDVFAKKFVCDLAACKGACCVEGDGGAPLTDEEAKKIEDDLPQIKPYLRSEGLEAIEKDGVWYEDSTDGEKLTTLINGGECAFVAFDDDGTAKCGIEQAWKEGKTDFKKPVSCHMYPVRIQEYRNFTAVNYHQWDICKAACDCGEKLQVPVYRFLKESLIRKFGEEWYQEMERVDELRNQ
ncbi:DUF3109 family protein [bacterium SCSIO 12741]|nr:DUF3109 family protein [bacterium SCSIO 12741]